MILSGFLVLFLIAFLVKIDELEKKIGEEKTRVLIVLLLIAIPTLILSQKEDNKTDEVIAIIKKQQWQTDDSLKSINIKINHIVNTVNQIQNNNHNTLKQDISQNILDSIIGLKTKTDSNFDTILSEINNISTENRSLHDSLVTNKQLSEKSEQLIKEIRNSKSQSFYPFRWYLWGSSLLLIMTCILLLFGVFTEKKSFYKWAIATAALSFTCKITIENELIFESIFDFHFHKEYDTSYLPVIQDTTLIIGPFKSGYDSLEVDGLKKLEKAKNLLSDNNKSISEIMLLGGVDKRPLRKKALLKFGDNLSLAQARANAIKQSLEEDVFRKKENMPKFIVLVNGANIYDDKDIDKFADSRYVKIICRYSIKKDNAIKHHDEVDIKND